MAKMPKGYLGLDKPKRFILRLKISKSKKMLRDPTRTIENT